MLFLNVFSNLPKITSVKDLQILEKNIQLDKNFSEVKLNRLEDFNELKSSIKGCSRNCLHCEKGKCIVCPTGLYSFNEGCYKSCPINLIANNLSFTCETKGVNFFKAYTISRCRNSCGKSFKDCRYNLFK